MSWNMVMVLADAPLASLRGLSAEAETLDFEDASSASNPTWAAAEAKGWTVLFQPFEDFAGQGEGAALPSGRVWTLLFAGVSSSHGFWLRAGGKLLRHVLVQDAEIVVDEGDSLPEEAAFEPDMDAEDWLFGLLQELTSLTVDDLFDLTFRVCRRTS